MKLSNKYNVPESTIKNMVSDGIISTSWPLYEEVYSLYQSINRANKTKMDIYREIADAKNMNEHTVKRIVSIMDKI